MKYRGHSIKNLHKKQELTCDKRKNSAITAVLQVNNNKEPDSQAHALKNSSPAFCGAFLCLLVFNLPASL